MTLSSPNSKDKKSKKNSKNSKNKNNKAKGKTTWTDSSNDSDNSNTNSNSDDNNDNVTEKKDRLRPQRRKSSHIPTAAFGVPKSCNVISHRAVMRASNILRTTNPKIFNFKRIGGGGLLPLKTALPIYLSLMLVENDGPADYLRVHTTKKKGKPIHCGMMVFWDQSDADYA